MSRRALITGVTGFIGGRLAARLLSDGWIVDALVRPSSDTTAFSSADDVRFHVAEDGQDLTPVFAETRPDVVFHLASLYLADHRSDQVKGLISSNVLFPTLLAEAMTATGVTRLVNTGTAWQQFEGEQYRPVNLYAATKQAAEDLLAYYADAHTLSVVTLRLYDTYGDGDQRRKLVQILIDSANQGKALVMSPGDQVVDLTHVDDVVAGFLMAADRLMKSDVPLSEIYLLSGERLTVKDLAALVAQATKRPVQAEFGGRSYRKREVMNPTSVGDRALPGWKPEHHLLGYISDRRR